MECRVNLKGTKENGVFLKVTVYYDDGEKIHNAVIRVKKIIGLSEELIGYGKTNPMGKFQCKIRDIDSSYKISVFEEEVHMKKLKVLSGIVENIDENELIEMSIVVKR